MPADIKEIPRSLRAKIGKKLAFFRAHDLVQYSVAGVVILFLIYQVVTPLVFLVWGSLKTIRPGAPGFFSLNLTVSNYVRALSQGEFAAAFLNSLIYSAGAAVGALLLAIVPAWITERTDTPGRSVIYGLSIVGLVIPGILTVVSWIFLASPNIGLLNSAARAIGFTEPPFDIFTLGGFLPCSAPAIAARPLPRVPSPVSKSRMAARSRSDRPSSFPRLEDFLCHRIAAVSEWYFKAMPFGPI
jgi:ABC-type glycerol-3-phosphate transport system permease component